MILHLEVRDQGVILIGVESTVQVDIRQRHVLQGSKGCSTAKAKRPAAVNLHLLSVHMQVFNSANMVLLHLTLNILQK